MCTSHYRWRPGGVPGGLRDLPCTNVSHKLWPGTLDRRHPFANLATATSRLSAASARLRCLACLAEGLRCNAPQPPTDATRYNGVLPLRPGSKLVPTLASIVSDIANVSAGGGDIDLSRQCACRAQAVQQTRSCKSWCAGQQWIETSSGLCEEHYDAAPPGSGLGRNIPTVRRGSMLPLVSVATLHACHHMKP